MSVWLAIPSARDASEANEVLACWREKGYKLAVFRDEGAEAVAADLLVMGEYKGYAKAVNTLCRRVVAIDVSASWIVTGGDDVLPAAHQASVIAAECEAHFGGTLGVMEPTGDRFMVDESGRCAAERVCIAPWMGRQWVERGYSGNGPLCEDYAHFFVDEDLARVTERLGLLWRRPDLTQYHDWWGRRGVELPAYLEKARLDWGNAKATFERRRDAGFPGHGLAA